MISHSLDVSDSLSAPPVSVLANVQDNESGEVVLYWVVLATPEGFVGFPKGTTPNMSALPGVLWKDVVSTGTLIDPHELSVATMFFERMNEWFKAVKSV